MKERTKNQKGITLIALIITIVVLLILAAVAINSITNEGIIDKAQGVVDEYELAQEKEKLQMEILQWQLINSNGTPTLETYLAGIYGEENVQLNVDKSITVTVPSGNKYLVAKDGNVTLLDGTLEEPEPLVISISLDKTTITKEIESGSTATETLTATLVNATGTLSWTSSNTSVASISGSGNTRTITLKAKGTATITVSYGAVSATCMVTVTEKQVTLIPFTYGGEIYYVEEGMTWRDFVNSSKYNVNGWTIAKGKISWTGEERVWSFLVPEDHGTYLTLGNCNEGSLSIQDSPMSPDQVISELLEDFYNEDEGMMCFHGYSWVS